MIQEFSSVDHAVNEWSEVTGLKIKTYEVKEGKIFLKLTQLPTYKTKTDDEKTRALDIVKYRLKVQGYTIGGIIFHNSLNI